jgi:hypothetical protein
MSDLTNELDNKEVYVEPAVELNGMAVDPLAILEEPENNNICPPGGC